VNRLSPTGLCWALFALLYCSAPVSSAETESTFRDIAYGPHERHTLDLWQAATDYPAPLVIFIHGGGWRSGSKADLPPTLRTALLARGVSVAAINYRYTSIAMLPAPVHDAARAVQFLRTKASDWRLDPQRFAAYGISAGGCTTLWLACHDDLADPHSHDPVARQSTRLRAAVALSPQVSLEPEVVSAWAGDQVLQHPMIARAVQAGHLEDLRTPKPEWVQTLREFSPIVHLGAADPPMMISNPRIDPLPAASPGSAIHHALFGVKLKERADAVGVICLLRIEEQNPSLPTPEDFLIEHLTYTLE
jgi:acetyl esterase/lipase